MRREGTPAWTQVVERRLEQAAEDARSRPAKAGIQEVEAGERMDGRVCRMPAFGYRVRVLSFPLRGNGLFQPLDSGLRRNDGGAEVRYLPGMAKGLSG